MAELIYHVATDWQEVEKLFNEITKLNSALDKVDTNTPREEVAKLVSSIEMLKDKYSDIITLSQQANARISDAFSGVNTSDNPLKGLGDNANSAAKTLKDSFDGVIGKVCELYDYINEVKTLIGTFNGTSDIIGNIGNKVNLLSDAIKQQELSLSAQSSHNASIIQQQQAELVSLNQQNAQAQSLNETANERVAIESEVASTIDDTTKSIEVQTDVVKENSEAIKEQSEVVKEIGDEFSDATLSEERSLKDKIEGLRQLNESLQERIANASSQQEKDALSQQYSENETQIRNLEAQMDSLYEKSEKITESAKTFFGVYNGVDENGNPFRVIAQSADEANEKIAFAQKILEIYPEVMQSISEKADDMRLNMYMTDEGERLVKEAERISNKLSGKTSTSQMFSGIGHDDGEQLLSQLQNIDSTLDNIKAKEQAIETERQKIEEQAKIDAENEAKRAQSSLSMRTQIMKAREELVKMIEAGEQGTPKFMALAQKAGDMREQLQRANGFMQYFDNPNRSLTTLKVGLQGVAGAASLVTSTIGLLNNDTKKMAEIQTKVQSILGIIVGLETTYNLVKKTSVVMIALEEVKTWALAKARGVQAAATVAATEAQEAMNVAMSKTPYGAIIALLVTLGTAIWAVTKALVTETEAEKKAREEKEANIKADKERQEKWAQSVAESASKQILSYKELQKKWNELGNDMDKKKKFINDNQTAFNNLGFAVKGVGDAENLLVQNTDAVVDAIMARSKALAYQELMTESYKKQIEEQMKSDQNNATAKGGQYSYRVKAGGNATNKKNMAYRNARAAGYRFMEGDTDENGNWTEQGAKRVNQYSSNYAARQRAKTAEEDKKRNKRYEEEQKKLQEKSAKALDEEKKKLEKSGVKTYTPTADKKEKEKSDSGKTEAEKAQEQRELMDKQKREQKRAAEDLELSTREARIKAMDESTEKVIERIKFDHDKEVLAIQRSYEDMRIKRIEAAKALWEKNEKNKGKNFFDSEEFKAASSYNAPKETENRDIRLMAADKQMQQSIESENEKRIQALLDYQKEYGDFQTKRAAITKEYDLKIDKEQDEIQKSALARQKERLISELNMKELQQSLDWETVFNNLEYQSVDALRTLKKQLAQALDAKDITAENAKVLAEKIREIEDNIARRTDVFSSWLPGLRERKRLTQEILEVEQEIKGLTTARNSASAKQDSAISEFAKTVGVSEGAFRQQWQKVEKGNIADISDFYNVNTASQEVKDAFSVLQSTTIDLSKSQENLNKAQTDYKTRQDALKNFTKGGSVGQYFKDVTAGMDATGIFGLVNQNAQSANALIGNIGLGDTEFGKGFADFAEGMQGFQNGVQSLMQGDVFGAINGVVDGIQGFGNVIGRAFGVNWSGGNEKEVAKTTERLTKQNESLQYAIESLTETLSNSYGSKALSTYTKALEAQETVNKNQMEILEAQMGYHSAHHSNAYYVDDNEIRKYNAQAQEAMRTAGVQVSTITGLQSIYNLTPEQLKAIRDFAPDLWRYLTEVGKYDKSEFWDAVVDQAGKTEELTEQIMKVMTTTTEESVFTQFLSQLKELAKGSSDVFSNMAVEWQEMVNEMIVDNFVGDTYQQKLKEWREQIYKLNKRYKEQSEGGMTMAEYKKALADLESDYQSYLKEAQEELNVYKAAGIVSDPSEKSSQSATANGIKEASYEQASSIVGILTAGQIIWEQQKNGQNVLNANILDLTAVNSEHRDIASDSRDILAGMAIHVEEIRDGMVDTLVPKIKSMESALTNIERYVKEQS